MNAEIYVVLIRTFNVITADTVPTYSGIWISTLLVSSHRQRLVQNIVFHLYFGQNWPTLHSCSAVSLQ